MKKAILFKTHVWSDSIEIDLIRIVNENQGSDIFVILQDDEGKLLSKVRSNNLRKLITVVTEDEIKSIYDSGYINKLLSNHWILMWFFRHYPDYDYYWSMEYDVKILGNSNRIWEIDSDADFLYPTGNYRTSANNKYNDTAIGDLFEEKYSGFLQLARYSNEALRYLDDMYMNGNNAQDEIATFTLLRHSGLSMSAKELHPLITGYWTCDNYYQKENLKKYQMCKKWLRPDELFIFHPIKS